MKPIAELHLHLDGSLRIPTMLEIAEMEGVKLPSHDEAGLYEAQRCGSIRDSLQDYLGAFAVNLSVMQSRYALGRIMRELVEDCAKDGLQYVEIRFMPSLHRERGLSGDEIMEAVLDGMDEGEARTGILPKLIVCSMRHVPVEETAWNIDLAIKYMHRGVVKVDMAGNDNLAALEHAPHYMRAKEAGLGITIHAAEAGPAERATEALDLFGAERIGHGIRIGEDPAVLERIIDEQIPLEVCPTSNVQIKQVEHFALHPAKKYFEQGALVCINTDNRMLADVTLSEEHRSVARHWWLDEADQEKLILGGLKAASMDEEVKKSMLAVWRHENGK